MKDAFSRYHPVGNMTYFVLVLMFGMYFMHPLCLGISLSGGFIYSLYQNGKKAIQFNLKYMLPMLFVTALINPAFNHEGVSILLYLHNGNPLTLESIIYGIAAATMFISVVLWFACYNQVMTSEKFIYLFGRIIPSLSLIFSMVLRFVPRFKAQIKQISYAQKCIGRDVSNGGFLIRVKNGIKIMSIMVTWALENAIETADSMKSRGYGLKGRTSFSIFTFDKRDKITMGIISLLGGIVMLGAIRGLFYYRYFPTMKGVDLTIQTGLFFTVYLMLCLTPILINLWEDWRWTYTQSKI